jgi:hypothetical protein
MNFRPLKERSELAIEKNARSWNTLAELREEKKKWIKENYALNGKAVVITGNLTVANMHSKLNYSTLYIARAADILIDTIIDGKIRYKLYKDEKSQRAICGQLIEEWHLEAVQKEKQ